MLGYSEKKKEIKQFDPSWRETAVAVNRRDVNDNISAQRLLLKTVVIGKKCGF